MLPRRWYLAVFALVLGSCGTEPTPEDQTIRGSYDVVYEPNRLVGMVGHCDRLVSNADLSMNEFHDSRLAQHDIGWLAWAWHKDYCALRRMTPDGNYTGAIDGSPTGLTVYGTDLAENPTYGLRLGSSPAVRTDSLPGAPPV